MKKPRWWVLAVALVLIGGGGWLFLASRKNAGAVTYETATAAKKTLTVAINGSGNTIVSNQAIVSPGISGKVTGLAVHLGDTVKKGQLLFSLDNPQLDSSLAKAYSSYLQAQQGVTNANNSLANDQTTLSNDQASLSNLEAATSPNQDQINAAKLKVTIDQQKVVSDGTSITVAKQQVISASNDYQIAKSNAAERTVTAPLAGVITALNVANGDQLAGGGANANSNASTAPVVIDDLGSMQASVAVNEADAPNVKAGQKASLTFSAIAGLTLTGTVESIQTLGTSSQGVVTYPVIINFDATDPRVKPAMTVSASITTAVDQDVLTVPSIAVQADANGNNFVQVMVNGKPQIADVTVGDSNDTDTQIKSGVNEGDVVITQTLQPGQSSPSSTNTNPRGTLGGIGALSGGGGQFTFRNGGGGKTGGGAIGG